MHQHIKYSLHLNDEIKEVENICQIEAGQPRDKVADWQSIFADCQYDTHHFIYAKFLGTKSNDVFTATKVQLYLQNYDGCTSIGFNGHFNLINGRVIEDGGVNGDPDYYPEKYPERRKFEFSIGLQALKGSLKDRVKLDYELPDGFEIRNGDVLVTSTFFTPADPEITKIYGGDEAMKNAIFLDKMFMKRIGEDVIVSKEGLARLSKLNSVLPDLVTDEMYSSIVNPDDSQVNDAISKISEVDDLHPKGILYPCKPTNSMFIV